MVINGNGQTLSGRRGRWQMQQQQRSLLTAVNLTLCITQHKLFWTAENKKTLKSSCWRRGRRKAKDYKAYCSNDDSWNEETDVGVYSGIKSRLCKETDCQVRPKDLFKSAQSHVSVSVQLLIPLRDTKKKNQGANKCLLYILSNARSVRNTEKCIQLCSAVQ